MIEGATRASEGDPWEPCHIQKDENRAKFWLDPMISLDYNYGFKSQELHQFHHRIAENEELIRSKWNEHFNV
ncbi:MAG: DUF4160 domain-containing protein [Candidatus Omnitrophota bacterium]|jgi:hypothetical protein|nr:MAG: DUF4160 domain-containing protein [Candidatus Omnitrophota bacterium]